MTRLDVLVADGTSIGAEVRGNGDETVVLVHGSCGSRADWDFVAPLLEDRFAVVTMDRRGRGWSIDGGKDHSIEVESADVAAMVGAFEGRVHLVGHSYGALCALGAAASANVMSLVLYEPPAAGEHVPADLQATVNDLVASGRLDEATALFLEKVAAIPRQEIEVIRSHQPAWNRLLDGMRLVPREMAAVQTWDPELIQTVRAPTLILVGERTSAPIYTDGLPHVLGRLAQAHVEEIGGQGHMAVGFDPSQVAQRLRHFIGRSRRPH